MIAAQNITLSFGERVLFKDVNIKFIPGNCYGIIGANGAGKSTFLKILSGEISADKGEIITPPGARIAVLRQDQNAFDNYSVINTIIMGHGKLYEIMMEKDAIYQKSDFTEEDGMRAAELEAEFTEMNGWEAEAEAGKLLSGLGIPNDLHEKNMKDLESNQKVRVLLAQALFGNPDILLLDEPTNNLDLESISWLEDFLYDFENTVIVVSHDRHFLNRICTHIADVDYAKISLFVGNYDFWYLSSQLAARQMRDEKKRREDKISELKEFIQRFSSNAAKSKQATSRKKLIDKLTIDDLKPSSRRFPFVKFEMERESGKKILEISNMDISIDGETRIRDFSLSVQPGDKIALIGPFHQAKSRLFDVLCDKATADKGSFEWGTTISWSYFPKDNSSYFDQDLDLVQWLRQFSQIEEEAVLRGFLGRMLFSGEEALKSVKVLSGGEKVRCMLSMMMQSGANFLLFDEPTNHLDLESITALNNALIEYPESIIFNSHDHQFVDTVANRIIEFTPRGIIDRRARLDEYMTDETIRKLRDEMYSEHGSVVI